MESWQLGVLLGILIVIALGLVLRLEMCHKSLIYALKEANSDIHKLIGAKNLEIDGELIANVKDELSGTIEDMIGSMRVPTAFDHIGGVIANVIQMREQWKIQKEASQLQDGALMNAQPSVDPYGTSQNEA